MTVPRPCQCVETLAELRARLNSMQPLIEANRQACLLNATERAKAALYRAIVRRRHCRRIDSEIRSLLASLLPGDPVLHHALVSWLTASTIRPARPPGDPITLARCTPVRGPCRGSRTRTRVCRPFAAGAPG